MQDERRPDAQAPGGETTADQAARDIETADRHAERRVRELKAEALREIERTEEAAKDRDEVAERPRPPRQP
ncbi:MAG TPA: hypothetical protein VIM86_13645 [Thermodesulfobacteriota bacterium]